MTWDLIRLCTGFPDDHCETWQHNSNERRLLEEKKKIREERKRRANQGKLTFKIGYVQKKINTFLRKYPEGERKKFESEEERSKRRRLKEIKEIKETLWKKSRTDGENLQTGVTTYNLKIQEDRLETIEALYRHVKRRKLGGLELERRRRKL